MLKSYKIRILLAMLLGFCVYNHLVAYQCFEIENMPSVRELEVMMQKAKETAAKIPLIAVNIESKEENTESEDCTDEPETESRFEYASSNAIAMRSRSITTDLDKSP